MSGPLTGLKVLDISTIVAAPFAASLLGDYGAEVLKVEMPGAGDGARGFPPFKEGKSLWWKVTNRNKKSITLDLRKPEGVEIFKRLLPRFDVLIENFRPGTLDRWGLSAAELWCLQPRLVILRATAFGQTGPYRNRPGFARVFEAMGGLTSITGEKDGPPMHTGYPLGDAIGGLFGALGVLAALWERKGNPDAPGEVIDLSMTEAMLRLIEFLAIEYDQLGVVRERSGNENQYSAPSGVFRTVDGHWVTLAGSTNTLYANNCRAINRPDLINDPKYTSNSQRARHAAALNEIFSVWLATQNLEDALKAFQEAQGTLAPVYSIDQIFVDPHFQAREAITAVSDEDFGSVRMQNVVPRFSKNPGSIRGSGRSMGYDNAEVYGEWLNCSEEQILSLSKSAVI